MRDLNIQHKRSLEVDITFKETSKKLYHLQRTLCKTTNYAVRFNTAVT